VHDFKAALKISSSRTRSPIFCLSF